MSELRVVIQAPTGAGSGQSNTSSNSGTGEGLALTKVGVDLPFKSLKVTGAASISSDADSITIDVTGIASGVASVTGDGVSGTATDVVLTFPDTSEVTETPDKKYVTDAESVVIGNTSNTNTGDQDLSGLQPILSEGAFVDGDKTKLDGIESLAEVNTINSTTVGEPTGSDLVLNTVSLTQAEYDAGTPVLTTFYIITDA